MVSVGEEVTVRAYVKEIEKALPLRHTDTALRPRSRAGTCLTRARRG